MVKSTLRYDFALKPECEDPLSLPVQPIKLHAVVPSVPGYDGVRKYIHHL